MSHNISIHQKNKYIVRVEKGLIDYIPEYLENRRMEIITLKEMLTLQNFKEIGKIGHRIKGHAQSYGFYLLDKIANDLEVGSLNEDFQMIERSLEEYCDFMDKVKIEEA